MKIISGAIISVIFYYLFLAVGSLDILTSVIDTSAFPKFGTGMYFFGWLFSILAPALVLFAFRRIITSWTQVVVASLVIGLLMNLVCFLVEYGLNHFEIVTSS